MRALNRTVAGLSMEKRYGFDVGADERRRDLRDDGVAVGAHCHPITSR